MTLRETIEELVFLTGHLNYELTERQQEALSQALTILRRLELSARPRPMPAKIAGYITQGQGA